MTDDLRGPARADRAIALWLWLLAATLFSMIVLGGVVRLTGSGLSITVWEPIVGTVPPLGDAAWERAFSLYRGSPEFRAVNHEMTLHGFKTIFWFEYFHRLVGRSIGGLIVLPLAYFAWRRRVTRTLVKGLGVLLVLGGLQGVVGWYMVASGLVKEPHVSHLRLTLHLGMGLLLFGYTVWLALLHTFPAAPARHGSPLLRRGTLALTLLAGLTMLSGGLVAGLKAGHVFPTFPLMAGKLVPDGLAELSPVTNNVLYNAATVHFQHRMLAYGVFSGAVALFVASRRAGVPKRVRVGFGLLLGVVMVQLALGIATVLLRVPVAVAAAHQGNAVLLLGAALYTLYALSHAEPGGSEAKAPEPPEPPEPRADPVAAGEASATR